MCDWDEDGDSCVPTPSTIREYNDTAYSNNSGNNRNFSSDSQSRNRYDDRRQSDNRRDQGPSRQDHWSNRANPDSGFNNQQSNRYGSDANTNDDGITFEIEQSNVGAVIGRGGSNIREVEQKFNVNLKIGQ